MHIERLVKMANDIGDFFKAEPNPDDAISGIAHHLQRFWDPRMRKQIVEHFCSGGEGLNELVRLAISRLAVEN